MATKPTPTTFATKADDSLAAKDAYALKTAREVINALPDVNDALSMAGLAGLTGKDITSALPLFTNKLQGLQVNATSLLQGIVKSNPALNSAISSLGALGAGAAGLKNSILSNTGLSNITATVNGIKATISNYDLGSLTSVGSLIGGIANTPFPISFTDNTGLSNLTGNIIRQASTMGIPGAYSAIATGLTNTGMMSAVTRDIAPFIINRSATDLLKQVTATQYRGQLTASRPNFIGEYSRQYQAPPASKPSQYRTSAYDISSSFSKLDSGWKTSSALGAGTLNLTRGVDVSNDLDRLLQANNNYASVPVPVGSGANYANLDTSFRTVRGQTTLGYDPELAQISALKKALPVKVASLALDTLSNLKASFPLTAFA